MRSTSRCSVLVENEEWPPPVTDEVKWHHIYLAAQQRSVHVREVKLWGKRVHIDADNKVLCTGCQELLEPQQLLEPGNGHIPSPHYRNGISSGVLI